MSLPHARRPRFRYHPAIDLPPSRRWRGTLFVRTLLPAVLIVLGTLPLRAQRGATAAGVVDEDHGRVPVVASGDTVLAAGKRYEASWLHRLFFGDLRRKEWLRPVRVPLLDLERTAGGLTPLRRGGGFQTLSLRFAGADGRLYKFRSLDKNPIKVLPPELRNTFAVDIVQDFIASSHPYGAFAAAPILNACGVLNAAPALVLLPDSPRLDSFRTDYALRLGTLEVHPDEGPDDDDGFGGSDKVVGTFSLFDKLQKDTKDRVNAREFLKARMVDVFMGDWDRHTDQWRWARFEDGALDWWHPIPRDRDQAFCRFDGLLPWIATIVIPQMEDCAESYPPLQYLTWSGRHLDRRFLTGLEWPVWDSLYQELTGILTDSLLAAVPAHIPPSVEGGPARNDFNDAEASLYALLVARRAGLHDALREYYEMLAQEAEIWCSDEDEQILVRRYPDGDVTVTAWPGRPGKRGKAQAEFFHRRFHAAETDEIRIHMEGGDDTCVIEGEGPAGILVRVIGGNGRDRLIDRSRARAPLLGFLPVQHAVRSNIFYDHGDHSSIQPGPSTGIDNRRVPEAESPEERYEPEQRDWGSEWMPDVMGGWNADLGVLLGGGATFTQYGFRDVPYTRRISLQAGLAPLASLGKALVRADLRDAFPGQTLLFEAGISGFEVIHYFGHGNETQVREEDGYSYAVKQTQVFLRSHLIVPLSGALECEAGAGLRMVTSDLDDEQLYLSVVRPTGYRQTKLFDASLALRWDSRDLPAWPTKGVLLAVRGSFSRGLKRAYDGYLAMDLDTRGYLSHSFPFPGTVAVRAGGRRVWQRYPYFDAAFLGGLASARGYEVNRYAGDASLYGGFEWRVPVTKVHFVVPMELGVFGFVETGRVFLDSERSARWHRSAGGGIWAAPVYRDFTISASIGSSDENFRFDVAAGFAF